jgi:hypothetical protein
MPCSRHETSARTVPGRRSRSPRECRGGGPGPSDEEVPACRSPRAAGCGVNYSPCAAPFSVMFAPPSSFAVDRPPKSFVRLLGPWCPGSDAQSLPKAPRRRSRCGVLGQASEDAVTDLPADARVRDRSHRRQRLPREREEHRRHRERSASSDRLVRQDPEREHVGERAHGASAACGLRRHVEAHVVVEGPGLVAAGRRGSSARAGAGALASVGDGSADRVRDR